MKQPRSVGRMLAVCLSVLVFAGAAGTSPSAPSALPRGRGLIIQHVEGRFDRTACALPHVMDVRRAVQRAYLNASPDAADSEIVRDALGEYGAQVVETAMPLGYAWEWNPILERWELVCSSLASFAVDFGDLGTVDVRVEDVVVLYY